MIVFLLLTLQILAEQKLYLNVGIDFEWPGATKALRYLSEVAKKCNYHVQVFIKDENPDELINQRLLQALKKHNSALFFTKQPIKFNGVISPVVVTKYKTEEFGFENALGCVSFKELYLFCNTSNFPNPNEVNCESKFVEGVKDKSFKTFYFIVLFVMLALTLYLSFFWGKNENST